MTREEAIKELSYIADEMPSMECADWKEAISIAIKALEQEPCNDAISRQKAIDTIDALYLDGDSAISCWANAEGDTLIGKYQAIAALDDLPPVTSQPKWIPVSNPQKELPKDRMLWVTIDDDRYAQDTGGYYWMGGLTVTQIYWDMTEWSENIVDYVLAYMDYTEPTPYKTESETSKE